jgi:iron complex transport system substrate-binding protein
MVCALGARDELVGISHECDHPVGLGAHRLTRARELGRTSGEIDKSVRSALSIYDVDLDALAAARPDVVITQDLCSVCAVSLDEVTRALREIAQNDVTLVSLQPTTLDDVLDDVARVGRAIERRSTPIVSTLRARIEAIKRAPRRRGPRSSRSSGSIQS